MAQDIELMGAQYSDVPAVELPKVGGGTAAFTDVTDTTATAQDVVSGAYFYNTQGVRTAGTAVIPTKVSQLVNDAGYITAAGTAAKVAHALTIQAPDGTGRTFDGSAAVTAGIGDLAYIENPIASAAEDTPAAWVALGQCLAYISNGSTLGYPSGAGHLINCANANTTFLSQLWICSYSSSSEGEVFRRVGRGGQVNAWNTNGWVKLAELGDIPGNVLSWSNLTSTDTLAQAQQKLLSTPGRLRTWTYSGAAAYAPTRSTSIQYTFTAYAKDSDSINRLFFSALDVTNGRYYVADASGAWHEVANTTNRYVCAGGTGPMGYGVFRNATNARILIPMPNNAGGITAVTYSGTLELYFGNGSYAAITGMAAVGVQPGGIIVDVSISGGGTTRMPCILNGQANATVTATLS